MLDDVNAYIEIEALDKNENLIWSYSGYVKDCDAMLSEN